MKVNKKICNSLNERPLYAESGIYIASHSDASVVNKMAELIQSNFTDTDENYASDHRAPLLLPLFSRMLT